MIGNMTDSYKFFENKSCDFYPCHKIDKINCLFCWCPLYPHVDCGGDYCLLSDGTKDCSNCTVPHENTGYDKVVSFLNNIKFNRKDLNATDGKKRQ
jgi:Zn-finger protein